MPVTEMYVEPPHLTIAVYSDEPEQETFARMCDVARELDCIPSTLVEVAPVGQDFELLSDLGEAMKVLELSQTRYDQIVSGQDPEFRVLRVAGSHRRFGKAIIEYQLRVGPGPHPIGVSLSAGPLGLPDFVWSGSERRSAYVLAAWSRRLLEAATLRCNAVYGAIGVEFSLPTPWQIKHRKPRFTTEFFISHQLSCESRSLEPELRLAFSGGMVSDWSNGLFFSGWAPYNSQRTTVDDPATAIDATLSALRQAIS